MMSCYNASGKESLFISPEEAVEKHLSQIMFHANDFMRKITNPSFEKEDLINVGVIGLLESIPRFEDTKGFDFKTYVNFRIRGAMVDFLRERDWMPRSVRKSNKDIATALRDLGDGATEQQIALALNISVESYRQKLFDINTMSILTFSELGIENLEDNFLSGNNDLLSDPEFQILINQKVTALSRAIGELNTTHRTILVLYYYEELSMKEISLILGLSEGRVSQLSAQMIINLRQLMGVD